MKITDYALRFIGRPYIWAGDGSGKSFGGFDCSGFVLECLMATGKYKGSDIDSKTLYKALKAKGWVEVSRGKESAGNICFWGSKVASITHVSLVLEKGFHIEAGGGGRKCVSASTSTGMVRVRPLSSRSDLFAILKEP